MPKMNTTAHFVCDMPNATPEEMKHAEALMRDPVYLETCLTLMNALASMHSKRAGLHHPFTITGTIHAVDHV